MKTTTQLDKDLKTIFYAACSGHELTLAQIIKDRINTLQRTGMHQYPNAIY